MTSYKWYGSHLQEYEGSADNAREKFTGKELDTEGADAENGVGGIQLSYFGARYYDAEIGMFTSTDPADFFWNSYSYVGGNPIMFNDPTGMVPDLAAVEGENGDMYIAACAELYELSPETFEAIMSDPTVISYDVLNQNIAAIAASKNGIDNVFLVGLTLQGQMASDELSKYNGLINNYASSNNISSSLIKGVITNEVVTRYWAGGAIGESILSFVLGKSGTYGPAQLGPAARRYSNLSIAQAMTFKGAIIGASNWLGRERNILINQGIITSAIKY